MVGRLSFWLYAAPFWYCCMPWVLHQTYEQRYIFISLSKKRYTCTINFTNITLARLVLWWIIIIMMFKRCFQHYFSYIMAPSAPVNAFLELLLPLLRTIFFPSHWLLSHITIVETMVSHERSSILKKKSTSIIVTHHHIILCFDNPGKNAFKTHCSKRSGNQQFISFPTMFSTLWWSHLMCRLAVLSWVENFVVWKRVKQSQWACINKCIV